MKLLFFRILYFFLSAASKLIKSRNIIKKKILIGTIIVSLIAITSCSAKKKPAPTCYFIEKESSVSKNYK